MKILSGYLSRYLICALTGLLLVLLLNIKNFDLHFILRGTQNLSSEIIIAHVPLESENIEIAMTEIGKKSPQLIVAPVSRKTSILLNSYKNILLIPHKSLKADADGAIRSLNIPHALLNKVMQNNMIQNIQTPSFINFRGPQNSFPSIYFYEIKNQKILPTTLKKKIVILDMQDPEDESFTTPVGDLTGAELLANIIDNLLLERWITPVPIWISTFVILLLTLLVSGLILSFSANLAFLGIVIIILTVSSFSFLLFDQFYIWLPLTSFLIQIFVCYFVFVNHKLNKKEEFAWRLEKEKIYKDEMEEMKKNFLNLFSHDLKTPIAKILGQIEILEGNSHTPALFKEGLTKIRKYSYELNQYVKNILKISQIEANRFQLKLEPCDINNLIKNAILLITPLAEEKKLIIREQLEPLFSINCDKDLVQQIILNILENAIKYSSEKTTIDIISEETENFIIVSIKDQGRGIDPADQKMIWEKFSRFDEQTEGTGLGLYLVRYFVEAHKGYVFVNSDGKNGSTIGFKLPI